MILALALAPVLALALFIWLMDRYDREPLMWLLLAFFAGVASIFPAIASEGFLESNGMGIGRSWGSVALNAFFVVAVSEELSKFILLRLLFYRRRFFTEPMNAIVYAVMLSLGFAAIESVRYMLHSENIFQTAIIRSYSAVPAHFVCAVFMGYFMGQARFTYQRLRFRLVLTGLLLAILAHGIYDFFLLSWWMPAWFGYISFGFLLMFIVIAVWLIVKAQKRSPFVRRKKWQRNLEQSREESFQQYLSGQKEVLRKRVNQRRGKDS